jgi:hypothetical protein
MTQQRKFNVLPELYAYLEERAERNFRSVNNELNAILAMLQTQDQRTTAPTQPMATVTPLFGNPTEPSDEHGPKRGPLNTISGYRGVYPYGKRWKVVVYENGRQRRLSAYDTPQEAALAYDAYVRALDPQAPLNFPDANEVSVADTDEIAIRPEALAAIEQGPVQEAPFPDFEDVSPPFDFENPPPGIVRRPRDSSDLD